MGLHQGRWKVILLDRLEEASARLESRRERNVHPLWDSTRSEEIIYGT